MLLFHPPLTHFPIALLLAHTLLTILYLRSGRESFETSAFHCLVLGWFGAIGALATGTLDAARQLPLNDALGWVNAHAATGIAVIIIYGQALLQRRRNPNLLASASSARRTYLIRIGAGCVLVILSGWLGGHLVYSLRLGFI